MPRNEMVHRTASALVLTALLIVCLVLGWPAFHILVAAGGALIGWEWTRMTAPGGSGADIAPFHFLLSILIIALAAVSSFGRIEEAVLAAAGVGISGCVIGLIARQRALLWAALGVIYVSSPVIALIYVHDHSATGTTLIVWLFLVVAATDIGAFLIGRSVGGPKLAPHISPAKTWSGAAGGLVLALIASVAFALTYWPSQWLLFVLGSLVIAVVAQLGDLLESLVKRRFDVKDAGLIIPGHGGLLDRVDGIVPAALVLALYLFWQGSLVT